MGPTVNGVHAVGFVSMGCGVVVGFVWTLERIEGTVGSAGMCAVLMRGVFLVCVGMVRVLMAP